MDQAIAGDEGAIRYRNVSAEQRAVGHNNMVAHDRVVSYLAVGHQEIVRAKDRFLRRFVRAVHGYVLTEDIVLSDTQASGLALIFQILWRIADDATSMKLIVRAHLGDAGQIDMWSDTAMC